MTVQALGGSGEPAAACTLLSCHGLPQRWRSRGDFVVLDLAFGPDGPCDASGAARAAWTAWRNDPERCDRLTLIALGGDAKPPSDWPDVQWPPRTPGWHHVPIETREGPGGRRQAASLMLGFGDAEQLLNGLVALVDAFILDGPPPSGASTTLATPSPIPALPASALSRLNRLAAPEATASACSTQPELQQALTTAQFDVRRMAGSGGQTATTIGRFAPRFVPPPAPGGLWPAPGMAQRHALVIGAGLAGASATAALARQGWRVTLLDGATGPASGASGNPGGLFHSIVHGDDGLHARAHRAAALATWAQVNAAIDRGDIPGRCDGLLRLEGRLDAAAAEVLQARLPWLAEQACWLDQPAAQAAAGIPVPSGGWLFRQGGWLAPGAYTRWLLSQAQAASQVEARWSCPVAAIRHDAARSLWQALDAEGAVLAEAPSLVLATATQAQALLDTLPPSHATAAMPLSAVRGQITLAPMAAGAPAPTLPVAGSGYVLTLDDGRLLCGATTQHHDDQPELREADHRHNLGQAHRLGAWPIADADGALSGLTGRVGWRATTPDRLPLVGALPWHPDRLDAARTPRREQVRMLPRERSAAGGLYILGGLGSRGITWAALAGELLAHWVAGSPCPVEADLRDAMDPGRFLARQHRLTAPAPAS